MAQILLVRQRVVLISLHACPCGLQVLYRRAFKDNNLLYSCTVVQCTVSFYSYTYNYYNYVSVPGIYIVHRLT